MRLVGDFLMGRCVIAPLLTGPRPEPPGQLAMAPVLNWPALPKKSTHSQEAAGIADVRPDV